MKSIVVLACLAAGAQFASAQYKAILSTPTAPINPPSRNGDVKAGVNLHTVSGGYAWGQYLGRGVKVSLADGSITYLENTIPPPMEDFSAALASDGSNIVGYTGGATEACVRWDANGLATEFTSPLWQETLCDAASGGLVGGYVENNSISGGSVIPTTQRAALWTSPTSFIDLHTGGNNFSQVLGMAGDQQVGVQSPSIVIGQTGNIFLGGAYPTVPGNYSAYLWHGSASGAVNLNPAGFASSLAYATNGSQQGGFAYDSASPARRHAILWSGTAASALDLNSAPWFDTEIRALSAAAQSGDGYELQFSTPGSPVRHALVWSGSGASVIDLNIFLPPGYNNAVAEGIDLDGNIVGHAWIQTLNEGYSFAPVIFKPQPPSPSQLLSIALSAGEVNQGDSVQGQVTLAGPAPAGGQVVNLFAFFQDGYPISDLDPVPSSVVVLEGQTTASFTFTTNARFLSAGGQFWTRIYANDGVVNRFALLKVDMQPFLTAFTIPSPVYGGTPVTGSASVQCYPWPNGPAVISLVSANPAILSVPATVATPLGLPVPKASVPVTTAQVITATVVPVTASINGSSITVNVTVLPAPPVSLTGISVSQEVVSGSPYTGALTFSGAVPFGGAIVSLVSDNPAVVPVPATVSAAQGQSTISFSGQTGAVGAAVTAHITATYNGVSLSAPITVSNEPQVRITNAEYDTIAQVVKVSATTTGNGTLSFTIDSVPGSSVAMSLSNGVWSGSLKKVTAAPGLITVWNSNGGSAGMAPTLRVK